jgi:hypothetical protein
MVTSGQGFVSAIRNGLAGSTDPPARAETRFASPRAAADALNDVTSQFVALYAGLTEQQLETICFHRRGNRSIRWYAAHRLAELAFHGWDLGVSLGRNPRFDDATAKLLLPTLLESNVPRTYAAGLSAERGSGERYLLRTAGGDAWTVTIAPEALDVVRGQGPADVTITAPDSILALLVYGRTSLEDPAIQVEGDSSLAERFAAVFPKP